MGRRTVLAEAADTIVGTIAPARRTLLQRPQPPLEINDRAYNFLPSPELAEWARATFIEWGGALYSEEHAHLEQASLGFLWASDLCESRGKRVLGTCECIGQGQRSTWVAQRFAYQLREWFGGLPDFLITISAELEHAHDRAFCFVVEHELRHCGQAADESGAPRFTKLGRPVFESKPHDVEIFVADIERYGAAGMPHLERLVAAARAEPEADDLDLWMACGTCAPKNRRAS